MLFLFNALLSPIGIGVSEENTEPKRKERPCHTQISRFKISIDASAVFDPWAIALGVFPRMRETATSIDVRDRHIEVSASILGPTVVFAAQEMDTSTALALLQPLLPPNVLFETSTRLKTDTGFSLTRTPKEEWRVN